MQDLGKKLDSGALKYVSGGSGSTTVKAVGKVTRVPGKQTKCPTCGGSLTEQCFSTDNGMSAYMGQECTACGTALVYGENIL
ncbi:MAG: hypothetical protein J6A07_01150 [Firmicutes bacterium]|nr:hypothetical protein [Bacillota bacterium]